MHFLESLHALRRVFACMFGRELVYASILRGNLQVCMCVCARESVCVFARKFACACERVGVHVFFRESWCMHVCLRESLSIHVCLRVSLQVCVCVWMRELASVFMRAFGRAGGCACVCAIVCACVRACALVRASVWARGRVS